MQGKESTVCSGPSVPRVPERDDQSMESGRRSHQRIHDPFLRGVAENEKQIWSVCYSSKEVESKTPCAILLGGVCADGDLRHI